MSTKALISIGSSAALLIVGIVLIAFTEEREVGVTLIFSALAAAGIPAIRDSVPKGNPRPPPPPGITREPRVPPPSTPPVPPSTVLLLLVLVGCGGATVVASETITSACTQAADRIADDYESGGLSQSEARDRLGGARMVCELIHGELERSAE